MKLNENKKQMIYCPGWRTGSEEAEREQKTFAPAEVDRWPEQAQEVGQH